MVQDGDTRVCRDDVLDGLLDRAARICRHALGHGSAQLHIDREHRLHVRRHLAARPRHPPQLHRSLWPPVRPPPSPSPSRPELLTQIRPIDIRRKGTLA